MDIDSILHHLSSAYERDGHVPTECVDSLIQETSPGWTSKPVQIHAKMSDIITILLLICASQQKQINEINRRIVCDSKDTCD